MNRDLLRLVATVIGVALIATIVFMMTYSRNMSRKEVRQSKVLHIAANVFYILGAAIWLTPIIALVLTKLLGV